MLAVDWLGCLVTACGLALLLRGRRRLWRALRAMALVELGRLVAVLLLGGTLAAETVGGAFSRMSLDGFPALGAQIGGLVASLLLSLPLGRRAIRDTLLCAVLAGVATLLLQG